MIASHRQYSRDALYFLRMIIYKFTSSDPVLKLLLKEALANGAKSGSDVIDFVKTQYNGVLRQKSNIGWVSVKFKDPAKLSFLYLKIHDRS